MPTIWRSALPDADRTPALLHEEVFRTAERSPDRTAVVDAVSGDFLTYRELTDAARQVGGGLLARGGQPGDVVALVAGNSTVFSVVLLGALAAGLAVAPADPALTAGELTRDLDRTSPRFVVADPDALPAAVEAQVRLGAAAVFTTRRVNGATPVQDVALDSPLTPRLGGDPDAVALLVAAGGPGGLGRRAAHTHAGAVLALRQLDDARAPLEPADVVSGTLPSASYAGALLLGGVLRAGATFVALPRPDLESLLAAVARYGVTLAGGTPPLAAALARDPIVGRSDVSSLRAVLVAGAGLPAETARACATRLDCAVGTVYGLPEMFPVAAPPKGEEAGADAAGQLVAGTEAVVVHPGTGERLPAGQPGELWLRAPSGCAATSTARTRARSPWTPTAGSTPARSAGSTRTPTCSWRAARSPGHSVMK